MNFYSFIVQEKERNSIEPTIRLIRVRLNKKEKGNYGIGER
jgi:hypothetical protein